MPCTLCSRMPLNLFVRSLAKIESRQILSASTPAKVQHSRFSTARPSRVEQKGVSAAYIPLTTRAFSSCVSRPLVSQAVSSEDRSIERRKKKERWQVQKVAVKEKLGGEAWNPRKKLSPDTMEGIRHLHQTQPQRFTTAVLAQHFKVSPEAIRRILKSNWRPSDEEYEERLRRWDKRGEKIWSNLVELGVKPPKRWRDMGVGRARPGQKPRWKSTRRNTVPVNDSVSDNGSSEHTIPIVDGRSGERLSPWQNPSMTERIS